MNWLNPRSVACRCLWGDTLPIPPRQDRGRVSPHRPTATQRPACLQCYIQQGDIRGKRAPWKRWPRSIRWRLPWLQTHTPAPGWLCGLVTASGLLAIPPTRNSPTWIGGATSILHSRVTPHSQAPGKGIACLRDESEKREIEGAVMFWPIAPMLRVRWLPGSLRVYTLDGAVHLLLVGTVVVMLFGVRQWWRPTQVDNRASLRTQGDDFGFRFHWLMAETAKPENNKFVPS